MLWDVLLVIGGGSGDDWSVIDDDDDDNNRIAPAWNSEEYVRMLCTVSFYSRGCL